MTILVGGTNVVVDADSDTSRCCAYRLVTSTIEILAVSQNLLLRILAEYPPVSPVASATLEHTHSVSESVLALGSRVRKS